MSASVPRNSRTSTNATAIVTSGLPRAPGHLFSADRRFDHHLRLNYGRPRPEQLESALKTIGRLTARMRTAAG